MAKVLVVIPHDRFRDEEFESLSRMLAAEGHEFQVGSSHHTEAKGHFGLIVKPDVNVSFVETKDYDAVVFVGGHGVEEYFMEASVLNLIRNFYYEKRLIGAIGMAVELLVYAGVVTGRKVTCDSGAISIVQSAGAYYTGMPVEIDGDIITGMNVRAKDDFSLAFNKALGRLDPTRGLRYA